MPFSLTSKLFTQPDSVHTIEDALAHILQPQPGQIGQSSSIEVTQHVQIETLPPVLVLHLKRFVYDAAADGIIKISKPVHVTPELEVSHGTIFSFLFPTPVKAKNPLRLDRSRNHGARFREICRAGALQAPWRALFPRRIHRQRALFGRCAPPEWRRRWRGGLATH